MAISFVGSATGTTSATLPAHQAGDLIIAFAYRDGIATAPTLASGWTDINSGGANLNAARLAYLIAAGSGTASGTWTNATSVVFHVYRGARGVGGNGIGGAASTSVSYPTVTMQVSDGTSWVAGFAGHRSTDTSLETPPSGMTNRATVADATDEAAGHDTNGGVVSWSATAVSVAGTSSGWRAMTVEILAPRVLVADAGSYSLSGQAANVGRMATAGAVAPLPMLGLLLGSNAASYTLAAASGSYALNGQAARPLRGLAVAAQQGIYSLSGQAATLGIDRMGSSGAPAPLPSMSLVLTGGAHVMQAGTGTYDLTGRDAGLERGLRVTGGQGAYALTGQAATIVRSRPMPAAQGSYALSGQAARLLFNRTVQAAQGTYLMLGSPALADFAVTASAGSYSLSGQTARLLRGLRVTLAAGSYSLTGQSAGLNKDTAKSLLADQGAYALTGSAASLPRGLRVAATAGSYTLGGKALGLLASRLVTAATGGYSLAGQSLNMRAALRLPAAAGTYGLSGQDAILLNGLQPLVATAGAFALFGMDAGISVARLLSASHGAYSLAGQTAQFATNSAVNRQYPLAGLMQGYPLVGQRQRYPLEA